MFARFVIGFATLGAALAQVGVAAAQDPRRLQVAAPAQPPPAAQVAAPVEPRAATAPEPWEMALVNLEAGTALIPSRNPGAYGRVWIEYLSVRDRRRPSFAWGFWGGWEGFRAGGVWGLEFPMMVFAGVKSPRVLAAVGGGANLFGLDAVDGKTGGGLLQPRAHARLGFHVGKVFLTATSDVQYGWGWGHPAQVVLMTGVSVGLVFDDHAKK
ncbi:MAG: hypothetical protein QM820_22615 [Minicystis sp.]